MIKLKDILLEAKAPSIFIPRRLEDRVERMVRIYIRNGSKGNLDLRSMKLTVLPDILKNVNVGGDFNCGYNDLTSLVNTPKFVSGTFICSQNNLKSLDGAQDTYVGKDFYCGNNFLTSLRGAPKTVGGDFVCHSNLGIFTKEQVRAVCDVKGKIIV